MNKRRPNLHEDEDGLIVIGEHETPKNFVGRVVHWFGEVMLWIIACFVPLMLIAYGICGIHNQHLPAWRMRKERFGHDAVGFSWVVIAIGVWGLGYVCSLKTGRPVLRMLGWVLAIVAAATGAWYMFKK